MAKGTRWIKGQEYLLNGRYADRQQALDIAAEMRGKWWHKVRVVKLSDWDFMIYVHGRLKE